MAISTKSCDGHIQYYHHHRTTSGHHLDTEADMAKKKEHTVLERNLGEMIRKEQDKTADGTSENDKADILGRLQNGGEEDG
jgi:ribosomal protein L13